MSEQEITSRLKEHLTFCINDHGKITKRDENYCIQYIMDFQTHLKRKEAERFYREKVLYNKSIECEKLNVTFDLYMDGEIIINAGVCGLINIARNSIKEFVRELQGIEGIVV